MKMQRRDVLISLAAASLWATRAGAIPVSQLLGPGNRGYIGGIVRRMTDWHERRWGPLQSLMSVAEREFFKAALASLDRWDLPLQGLHGFERVLFSHKYDGGEVSHARLAIAPQSWSAELRELALRVARARGLKSLPDDLFGFGWDFKRGEWKVYCLHNGPDPRLARPLAALVDKGEEARLLPQKISCVTYKNGKATDRKLIVAYKELPDEALSTGPFVPASAAIMQIRRESGEREWFFRLWGFNLYYLPPELRTVALSYHRDFALTMRNMAWGGTSKRTLYYP